MKTPRMETEKKYLTALKEIKERLDAGEKVTMTQMCYEYSISKAVGSVLISKGIVKRIKSGYVWNSIEPNIRMVKAVIVECNKYNQGRGKDVKPQNEREKVSAAPRVVKSPMQLRTETMNTKEISLFWGLVKINIKTK